MKKASIANHTLTIIELLEIALTIRTSRSIKIYLQKHFHKYPVIGQYHNSLFYDKIVEHHINESLDERGFVKDKASRELRDIRKSIIEANDTLHCQLDSILRKISEEELLQDDIITTRDGRQVIPVKVENRNRVPGFIHSTSSSGATVFIEPAETLDLNNKLRELQLKEQREIHRILSDLTKQVQAISKPLENSFSTLTDLDVIFARGKYSIEIIGNSAHISEKPGIILYNARHPILLHHMKREEVVPLSIELGETIKSIVITGPNAGGKTVAMKTVGLLTLCTLAGIHIPADSDSEIFPFTKIFVEIGDDQSIENDLSTFSSHLISLQEILSESDIYSLVLIDEICAGTDPTEGGALASAVLNELSNRNIITIATTHHGVLKAFAHETAGMINASMEYDQSLLKPTYKFRTGLPGSSYAFELAERLGISKDILRNARNRVGEEKNKFESLVIELERQTQEYKEKLKESLLEKSKLESLILSYEQKTNQLRRDLGVIKKKAVEEAKEIVKDAQKKVEISIKEIRESGAQKEIIRSSKQIMKDLGVELHKMSFDNETISKSDQKINIGDMVGIRDGYETGEIVDIIGGYGIVLCGTKRIRVKISELKTVKTPKEKIQYKEQTLTINEAKNEIDLRGLFGDEAIQVVQNFLDNAFAAGFHRVDIIHGKGSGSLRKKIAEFVKSYPHVKSFRLGEWNEGGTGVTVVELN